MNQKIGYALWGGLVIVCAGLGFIPSPEGGVKTLLFFLSLLFFLPPCLLLLQAIKRKDRRCLRLLRDLSLVSLGLSLAGILLNILFAAASPAVGAFLNALLIILSAPMICSGHWALSLFLWACLLMASLMELQKKE